MKAGIIGLGHGSRVLINSFKLSNVEVYGVASKNYNNAKKIGKEKKIKNIFKNWRNLIKDKNIDVVAIAVPAFFQIEIVKECIKQKKIILCEKPLGINIRSINNTFSLLSKYKKLFLINYIYSEHEAFKKFNFLISKKKKLISDTVDVKFYMQTYANKNKIINWKSYPYKGGGLINLFLSHVIDYLVLFFGKIRRIKITISKSKNLEKSLHCIFEFKSGIKANIYIDSNNPQHLHSIKFCSKKYQLILQNRGKDYCKNFKLYYVQIDKRNSKTYKKIEFNNKILKFKEDSRILLTSNIINKLKNPTNKYTPKNILNRFSYNENILNKARFSEKKGCDIVIYE